MWSSNNAVGMLAPSLLVGADVHGWSKQRDQVIPANARRSKSSTRWPGRQIAEEEGTKMKFLANTTAVVVALSLMVGLLIAQRNYQDSWREPSAMQAPANTVAQASNVQAAGNYKVVLK